MAILRAQNDGLGNAANKANIIMLNNIADFIKYFDNIRRRTLNFIQSVPADKIDWSPAAGEFSFGDLIRHLAAAENMFVGAIVNDKWTYVGHAVNEHQELHEAIEQLNQTHTQAMAALQNVGDSELMQPRSTLDGPQVKAWRLLMALAEHEIHHRSQLAVYLTLNQIKPPHIYGLGVEDVIARATG